MEVQNQIYNIHQRLQDDESKMIFTNRLMFSLTQDISYIYTIIRNTELYKEIEGYLNADTSEKYIVSAGYWGKNIIDLFSGYEFKGILDNNKIGSYKGIDIFSLQQIMERYNNESFYISSTNFNQEFKRMLIDAGINEEKIVDISGMMLEWYHTKQYFDLPQLPKEEEEVFADCGCFDGENSVMFSKWANKDNFRIYAFEPDSSNLKKCIDIFSSQGIEKYELINKGVWSGNTNLCFEENANEGSKLSDKGEIVIPVTSIDSAIEGKVTFIKMDIEGSEYEALIGAKNHIEKYKPKLAISIYHKPEDIWEIPNLILSFNSNYKFYLRHYSLSSEETVLYAI